MVLFRNQAEDRYAGYADINGKISRDVKSGLLFRIARGVYETDGHADAKYLAGCICGPSYLSFGYALSVYDLIPDCVQCYTSATFRKGRYMYRTNGFGNFFFRDVPDSAYPWGYYRIEDGGYSCLMATPEKALCDKLYTMPPVKSMADMADLLFESLRMEEDDFWNLSADDILAYAPLYRSGNLNFLAKFVVKNRSRH